MQIKTSAVRSRLIGEARKSLKKAAGGNQVISKSEAKKLPRDLQAAVDKVRVDKPQVRVDDAVDVYASKVSRVLSTVDQWGKGVLSEAEVQSIKDPALRRKVLDTRAALLAGTAGVLAPRGGTGRLGTTAQIVSALSGPVAGLGTWWESGDNGVNVSVSVLKGKRTLQQALEKVVKDPAAPWTWSETNLNLEPAKGAKAIEAFQGEAESTLEAFKDDGPTEVQDFVDAVAASFAPLSLVRFASGGDLGGHYLLGKASDGYVAVVVQGYRDA